MEILKVFCYVQKRLLWQSIITILTFPCFFFQTHLFLNKLWFKPSTGFIVERYSLSAWSLWSLPIFLASKVFSFPLHQISPNIFCFTLPYNPFTIQLASSFDMYRKLRLMSTTKNVCQRWKKVSRVVSIESNPSTIMSFNWPYGFVSSRIFANHLCQPLRF